MGYNQFKRVVGGEMEVLVLPGRSVATKLGEPFELKDEELAHIAKDDPRFESVQTEPQKPVVITGGDA